MAAGHAGADSRLSLADMSPGYFGLVMATGIVSLAAFMLGHRDVAVVLFYLNIVQYGVLCLLYAARAGRYPRRFFGDMVNHLRSPGYFTAVAATGVLASQVLIMHESVRAGWGLWVFALLLWLMLSYAIFTALTVSHDKPTLDHGINGGWLLAVVATQTISVTSALLAARIGQPYRLEMNLLALSMWLWGGMLYIWMISLIFYRYTFFRFEPDDLAPPHWIDMGAMAISALAGSLLVANASQAPYLASLLPFLKGFTVFYWATGTWWIPMLLLLDIWRYGYEGFPFRYNPLYWGAVFPLGMYTVCTWKMSRVMGFAFLFGLPRVFFYVALVAWLVTFLGMLHRLARGARRA